jgi:hypothetical protein
MKFHKVERMDQVFDLALLGEPRRGPRAEPEGDAPHASRLPERQAARDADR